MQNELNLKRLVRSFAAAIVAVWLPTDGSAADGQHRTIAVRGQQTSTAVLSLEGNDWLVAADPGNVGRDEAWWKSPRPDAGTIRVPGIFQEALPGYHGVAWYWPCRCSWAR